MLFPLRRAGVGDLRALFIPHPGVDMAAPPRAFFQDPGLVFQEAFAHADPMAEVAVQFKIGESVQEAAGNPRMEENPAAVGFMDDRDALIPLDRERGFECTNGKWERPPRDP